MIYIFLLLNIKSLYREIDNILDQDSQQRYPDLKLQPKTFYWFELKNNNFLAYIDNSLKYHEKPFLLYILVSWADKNSWLDEKNCLLLYDTFNDFYQNSAFLSLIVNNKTEGFFRFSINLLNFDINGEIQFIGKEILVTTDFELKELTICNYLLEPVKFGTFSKNQFYQVEDISFGIFVNTYYVVYKDTDNTSNNINLFRNADLIEIGFIRFETNIEHKKSVLTYKKTKNELFFLEYTKLKEQNEYNFLIRMDFLSKHLDVVFDSEENKNQFKFFIDNEVVDKVVDMPSIEKLCQVATNQYRIKNLARQEIDVELPVYFFGEKIELTGFIFTIRFVPRKNFDFIEASTFFGKFFYKSETNHLHLYYKKIEFFISFDYKVENGEISLEMIELRSSSFFTDYKLIRKETTITQEVLKTNNYSSFINGAIIYIHEDTSFLSDSEYITTPANSISSTMKQKPVIKRESKDQDIYLILGLLLLAVGLVVGWIFYNRKKRYKKTRFNKKSK